MAVTIDRVVEAYVKTRQEIQALEKELEAKLQPLKAMQEKREQYMLGQLNEIGAKNVKTAHGTVYTAVKESVTMGDWDSFLNWVKEGERYEFLNKAVNKTAALEEMGDERNHQPPPGVNYTAIRTVQVRKS